MSTFQVKVHCCTVIAQEAFHQYLGFVLFESFVVKPAENYGLTLVGRR